VIDGRRSVLEPVEDVVDLVRSAADAVGAPTVYVSSSCELEFLSRDLARQKVLRLGEAAARLREELA
jgi:methionine synthase II (cobalamin-independent)